MVIFHSYVSLPEGSFIHDYKTLHARCQVVQVDIFEYRVIVCPGHLLEKKTDTDTGPAQMINSQMVPA